MRFVIFNEKAGGQVRVAGGKKTVQNVKNYLVYLPVYLVTKTLGRCED